MATALGHRVGDLVRLRLGYALGAQGRLQVRLVLEDQHRAEHREAEAGTEVADRLRDPGRLAVAVARHPVERVGVGRAEDQADADAGDDDEGSLRADREVGQRVRPEGEAAGGDEAARDDRRPRASLVEDLAAPLGGDEEAGEEDQQVEAGFRGVFAEQDLRVMLAKKNKGTKGIIKRKRIALSTAKARLAKMRICISGNFCRSS